MSSFLFKLKLIWRIIMADKLTPQEIEKFVALIKNKGASQEIVDAVKIEVTTLNTKVVALETKVGQLTEFSDDVIGAMRNATLDEAATFDAITEAVNSNPAIPENNLTPAFPA